MTLMMNHGNLPISENQRPLQFMKVKQTKYWQYHEETFRITFLYPPRVLNMDNEDWS